MKLLNREVWMTICPLRHWRQSEILDTQNRNDWSAFAELLADDLVAIDEDGIHSKKELLEQIRAAEVRFSDYKMESVKVIPQTNGAIVAYKETLGDTEHGKPFTLAHLHPFPLVGVCLKFALGFS